MQSLTKLGIFTFCFALAGIDGGAVAAAVPPNKPAATITITALTSSSTLNITPLSPGNSGGDNLWKYVKTTGVNTFYEVFPVQVCVQGVNGNDRDGDPVTPWPVTVTVNSSGGNLSDATPPTYANFTANGCQTENIVINATALAAGNYNRNFNFAADVANNGNKGLSGDLVQIHLTITSAPSTTCFITDSGFNFLLDCDLNPITEGTAGRFAIVANKKGQVSTNPGQFYYNLLWTNTTGSEQTVSVTMGLTNVTPHGAQAIHAALFPNDPTIDAATFAAVNDAIPSGDDGEVESIVVPDGWTLWVTYHLQWSQIGQLFPAGGALTCATAGAGGLAFLVQGVVQSGDQTLGTCSAGAAGYKK